MDLMRKRHALVQTHDICTIASYQTFDACKAVLRILQHSINKTLQHLYRFQVIRGPQNSKKRTKRGPNFEQKGDPKGAQMET